MQTETLPRISIRSCTPEGESCDVGLDILFHSMKVRSEGESYDVGLKTLYDIHLYAACHDAFFFSASMLMILEVAWWSR